MELHQKPIFHRIWIPMDKSFGEMGPWTAAKKIICFFSLPLKLLFVCKV